MKRRLIGCVAATLLGLMPIASARAESGLRDRGILDGMKPEVSGLVTLKFDRSSIRLDRAAWGEQKDAPDNQADLPANLDPAGQIRIRNMRARVTQVPAEAAFRRIQAASQANQSSGMTSNTTRSLSFDGAALSGKIEATGEVVTVRLSEKASPARTLEITDDPQGGFRLLLTADDGNIVLINQAASGAASLACVVGGKSAVASGKSFAEVFSQNREVFETIVMPAIEHVGVGLSLSANTPLVRARVVSLLMPLSEAEKAAAAKLLGDLASPDFATRETAREALSARLDRYEALIREHSQAEGVSKDVQFTLEQLLGAADAEPTRKLIAEMKLLEDAEFLISILEAIDADARKVVTAHLTKLTGESFGEDVEAWKKWAAGK
jgi:hypothetical protein